MYTEDSLSRTFTIYNIKLVIIQTPKIHAMVSILHDCNKEGSHKKNINDTYRCNLNNIDIKIKADKEDGGYEQYGRDNSRKDRNQH